MSSGEKVSEEKSKNVESDSDDEHEERKETPPKKKKCELSIFFSSLGKVCLCVIKQLVWFIFTESG